MDVAIRIVGDFGNFDASLVVDSPRKRAVVIEKVPLSFELDDRMMRGPTHDRVEDTPSEYKRACRALTRRIHDIVGIAGRIR